MIYASGSIFPILVERNLRVRDVHFTAGDLSVNWPTFYRRDMGHFAIRLISVISN